MYKNSCMVLIYMCKNNLNLPICSFFFSALCLVASVSLSSCCHACFLTALGWFFFLFICFWESRFCSPAIIQTYLSQSKAGYHSFYFADKKNIIELVRWVYVYKLYQHVTIWGEICPIFNFCGKFFWPIRKLDKNI